MVRLFPWQIKSSILIQLKVAAIIHCTRNYGGFAYSRRQTYRELVSARLEYECEVAQVGEEVDIDVTMSGDEAKLADEADQREKQLSAKLKLWKCY